uniref:Uncharacterized protein n=1 Tax=Mustela putorius furo TaxID=9669 RepID=M3Y3Z1_MUSPF
MRVRARAHWSALESTLCTWRGGGWGGALPGQVEERVHCLFGDRRGPRLLQPQVAGLEGLCARAGLDDERQSDGKRRGAKRGEAEVGDGDAAQAPERAGVEGGGARHQAADNQRQDDHAQHAEQHLAGEGQDTHDQ